MRNAGAWTPSKFIRRTDGALGPSHDPGVVGIRSRLVVSCMAPAYDRALRTFARGRLLDLGCGTVPLYAAYKEYIKSVTCLDWPNSLHSSLHVDVAANLNRSLPLRPRTFDTVLATDVLEHLAEPTIFFREMATVLVPSGTLILGLPFLYWLHEAPHDYLRHTEFSLRRHCQESGLRVLSLEPYGGPVAVVMDIIGKQIRHERLAQLFQRAAVQALRWGSVRAMDSRDRKLFPLGYCLVATLESDDVA